MAAVVPVADLLLGPPELCNYIPLDDRSSQDEATTPPADLSSQDRTPSTTGDDFLDMLRNGMQGLETENEGEFLNMGLTENFSPTFLTSGNPLLDFFFHVVPDTPCHTLTQLLQAAWDRDALTALKLISQLRGVRGTGKSDRESFYTAACWIHSHHPNTLAVNVNTLAQFWLFQRPSRDTYSPATGIRSHGKTEGRKDQAQEKNPEGKGKVWI